MKSSTDKLSTEKVELLKTAARNRLLNFCQVVDKQYIANWHHEVIANKLEEAYRKVKKGEPARVIIEMPPRHGKSELATIKFPAWMLGKDPTIPIIQASYSSGLATKFGMKTRDTLKTSEYQEVFPDTRLRKDTKSKTEWMTTEGGSYSAVGAGGSITGSGALVSIVDDPVKGREEAESATQRDKIWDWYRSVLSTRMDDAGAIIVIMTRWHQDDLVGRLLQQEKELKEAGEPHDEWERIRFPAIAEEEEIIDGEIVREPGDALWPTRFDIDNLKVKQYQMGAYEFSALYQQNPISSETQEFKEKYWRYYDVEDIRDTYLDYTTTVDPAIGQKSHNDNSVVLTVAKEVNGPNWYRIREDAGKYTPKELINLIFKHQEEYESRVYVETVSFQKSLKYGIQEEQNKRQRYFTLKDIKSQGNKETRIRGLLPLYENGVIFHKHSDKEYEREALTFPRGRFDDRLDAMAMQLQAVKNTSSGRVARSYVPQHDGYFGR